LLLKKHKIDFTLIEKKADKSSHPSAHLINLRSMEIMTELNLSEHIYQKTEDLNFFRYYRYMKRLLSNDPGDTFAVHDHFFPSIE